MCSISVKKFKEQSGFCSFGCNCRYNTGNPNLPKCRNSCHQCWFYCHGPNGCKFQQNQCKFAHGDEEHARKVTKQRYMTYMPPIIPEPPQQVPLRGKIREFVVLPKKKIEISEPVKLINNDVCIYPGWVPKFGKKQYWADLCEEENMDDFVVELEKIKAECRAKKFL